MEVTRQRETWVDFAKGLGILLVFVGHTKLYLAGWTVYIVHMPLFFFLSGYLFNGYNSRPGAFIWKKVKSLLIPYYVLGIGLFISTVWVALIPVNYQAARLGMDYFPNLIYSYISQQRFGTLWYIAALFWMNLIMLGLVKLWKNKKIPLLISSLVMAFLAWLYYKLGGGDLPGNIDIVFAMMFFYVLGYIAKETGFAKRPKIQAKPIKLFVLFMIISAVIGWGNIALTHKHVDIYWRDYGNWILMFIAATIGIVSIVCLSQKVQWKPITKLGENSILFYAWHQCMVFETLQLWAYRHHIYQMGNESFPSRLFIAVLSIAVSLVIFSIVTWIVKKLPFRWIFGVK